MDDISLKSIVKKIVLVVFLLHNVNCSTTEQLPQNNSEILRLNVRPSFVFTIRDDDDGASFKQSLEDLRKLVSNGQMSGKGKPLVTKYNPARERDGIVIQLDIFVDHRMHTMSTRLVMDPMNLYIVGFLDSSDRYYSFADDGNPQHASKNVLVRGCRDTVHLTREGSYRELEAVEGNRKTHSRCSIDLNFSAFYRRMDSLGRHQSGNRNINYEEAGALLASILIISEAARFPCVENAVMEIQEYQRPKNALNPEEVSLTNNWKDICEAIDRNEPLTLGSYGKVEVTLLLALISLQLNCEPNTMQRVLVSNPICSEYDNFIRVGETLLDKALASII